MENETARWALYKQYEEINQNFRTVWQLYLTFYTANLTINVALAFVHTTAKSTDPIGWVVFALTSIDLLVAGSSIFLWIFTHHAAKHAKNLSEDIASFALQQGETLDASICFRPTLPESLCYWAAGANVAGMLLVAGVWLALYTQGRW